MLEPLVTKPGNKASPGFRFFITALFYAVVLMAAPVTNASELLDMLEKMSSVSQNRNYEGTFILRKSNQISTFRVNHCRDKRGVWESLESLTGEPRQIIRQNNKVISIFPDKKLITISHSSTNTSLHQKLPKNLRQLEDYYSLQNLGSNRIAGYESMAIDLKPKDKYRYGYRYWMEKDTGMLLRADVLDKHNNVVEQMMFTDLKYLKHSSAMAFKNIVEKGYHVKDLDADTRPVVTTMWRVKRPPAGFELTRRLSHKSLSKSKLLQLVYSDGLASVSVFIEPVNAKTKHLLGASSMGAINAYGEPAGNYYVTVVGEVPEITVMQMAKSTVKLSPLEETDQATERNANGG